MLFFSFFFHSFSPGPNHYRINGTTCVGEHHAHMHTNALSCAGATTMRLTSRLGESTKGTKRCWQWDGWRMEFRLILVTRGTIIGSSKMSLPMCNIIHNITPVCIRLERCTAFLIWTVSEKKEKYPDTFFFCALEPINENVVRIQSKLKL